MFFKKDEPATHEEYKEEKVFIKKEINNIWKPKDYFQENFSGNQLDKILLKLLKSHNSDQINSVLNSKSKKKKKSTRK